MIKTGFVYDIENKLPGFIISPVSEPVLILSGLVANMALISAGFVSCNETVVWSGNHDRPSTDSCSSETIATR